MELGLMFLWLFLCEAGQGSVIRRDVQYHHDPRSWRYAQTFCRDNGGMELLTVVTQSEVQEQNMDSYYAWIALRLYLTGWGWYNPYYSQSEVQSGENCGLTSFSEDKIIKDVCEWRHFFFCHYWEGNKRRFTFYHESKSWDEAFQFCQSKGQHLAVYDHWNDPPSDSKRDFPVWTGLYHDGASWSWSDGEYSDYWRWGLGLDPGPSPGSGLCGSVWSQSKSLSVHNCSEAFPFLCYSHNLVLVQQNVTWEEALARCEAVSPTEPHQLLSVEQSDLLYANSKAARAQTDRVWLGLRFLGGSWFWSDGQTVSLPGLPACPGPTLRCGALVLDRTSNVSEPRPAVEPSDCGERLNLLCYRL